MALLVLVSPVVPPYPITTMVEKPDPANAPSNLIISGRYILQPEIFELIENQEKGAGGEIQITDAMISLLASQKFHGTMFDGETYDCGNKIGFLRANVAYALNAPDIGEEFKKQLTEMLSKLT